MEYWCGKPRQAAQNRRLIKPCWNLARLVGCDIEKKEKMNTLSNVNIFIFLAFQLQSSIKDGENYTSKKRVAFLHAKKQKHKRVIREQHCYIVHECF